MMTDLLAEKKVLTTNASNLHEHFKHHDSCSPPVKSKYVVDMDNVLVLNLNQLSLIFYKVFIYHLNKFTVLYSIIKCLCKHSLILLTTSLYK